jgi:hypothetical protein
MSSYWANALCIVRSRRNALITIGRELTWRLAKMHRSPEEYSVQQRVLWWSFVKWAVCIITTNAAPPNTHPMRRQHRIDCLQNNRRLRGLLRRRRDLCATGTLTSPLNNEPTHMLLLSSRTFGFFVGTIW